METQAELVTVEGSLSALHFQIDRLVENFVALYDKLEPIRVKKEAVKSKQDVGGVPAIPNSPICETIVSAKSKLANLNSFVKETIRCVQLNDPPKGDCALNADGDVDKYTGRG